jgi:acyl-coenzyme A synthetase/AMP-(fatty) acid ligase
MNADFDREVEKSIALLLQGPVYPEKKFASSGITFAEVYAMAASLQHALAAPEYQSTPVCLAADNRAIIAAALLASLAGGPSLLLPFAFSEKALKDAHKAIGFTLALADTKREFPDGVKVISPQLEEKFKAPLESKPSSRTELLKIFTGGSTGAPQAWSKTAANIFGEGVFLARNYEVTAEDCIVATIAPYHIYGLLFSVVLPLVSSATIVDETPSFPNEIVSVAHKHGASILVSVPAHYRVIQDKKIPLRLAFSSAGMLDRETNTQFSANNQAGIIEVYGSTETGGIATRNSSQGEEFFTSFPVVDWKAQDQRLMVKSPFISPELLADADYFSASDRIEAIDETRFSLKGRADTITKVGGKRVDLDEISLLIKSCSGVSDCVVVALKDSGGREHRIGALIQGDQVEIATIRKHLTDSLEPYAQPRRMSLIKSIPVKNNGKYDWPAITRLLENE